MLDIKFIRENSDAVKKAIKDKGIALNLDELLKLDSQTAELGRKLQTLREEKNALTARIPDLKGAEKNAAVEKSRSIGDEIGLLEVKFKDVSADYDAMMYLVPNIPANDVPIGKDDTENVVRYKVGESPRFDFEPKSHYDILEANDWADFKRISKVCGTRAYSLKGAASRLEIALHMYMMDKMADKGFTMITVPSVVREAALFGTGHFPFGRDDAYYVEKDDIYLAGTAEVVLNSLHSDEILEENQLPILYAGYSPCFRREAGAAGKDTRGLIRVHQFMKVEQYVLCKADIAESKKWFETLLACAEEGLQELELPYRVIECCTGDMGAGKYKMYDIETWMPSENRYRETHSCSNLTDWQARRTNLRYRENGTNKVRHCFTLNNTGIATPRIIAQFLENHQTKDGKVRIPMKLRRYMNDKEYL